MWQYTKTNDLKHYGKKGMKWGQRRALRKTVDGEQRSLISKKEQSLLKTHSSTIQKHMSEASRLAKKYNLDEDDGGGGSTKKARDAGYRYMQHLEEADNLKASIHSNAVKAANSELTKKYTSEVLNKIGRKGIVNFQ